MSSQNISKCAQKIICIFKHSVSECDAIKNKLHHRSQMSKKKQEKQTQHRMNTCEINEDKCVRDAFKCVSVCGTVTATILVVL